MSTEIARLVFLLSVEQHEILLAFEEESSLTALAARVRRDPSVVSRTLKAISEAGPLLEKRDGRWRLTPLGRQLNRLTRGFLQTQRKLLQQESALRLAPHQLPAAGAQSALLMLGVQKGFQHPAFGPRNNPEAEARLSEVLRAWRERGNPILYCQHLSLRPHSPLREGSAGSEFLPGLEPRDGELVIRKSHNSAFAGSPLEAELKQRDIRNVILGGFSTNHCVDATARAAFDLGFNVFVLADATGAFDRLGPDGKTYSGEVLHAATLTTLHQEYATVLESEMLLRHLAEETAEFPVD